MADKPQTRPSRTYQDVGRNMWFSAAPVVRRTNDDIPKEDR